MKVTEKLQLAHAPVIRMHDQGLGQDMSWGATAPVPSRSYVPDSTMSAILLFLNCKLLQWQRPRLRGSRPRSRPRLVKWILRHLKTNTQVSRTPSLLKDRKNLRGFCSMTACAHKPSSHVAIFVFFLPVNLKYGTFKVNLPLCKISR